MAVSDVLALTVPVLLAGVGLYGALTGTDVFSALTAGALDGLKTVVRIFPALVALLAAVSMLRASGALDALTRLCAPVLACLSTLMLFKKNSSALVPAPILSLDRKSVV